MKINVPLNYDLYEYDVPDDCEALVVLVSKDVSGKTKIRINIQHLDEEGNSVRTTEIVPNVVIDGGVLLG